MKEYDVKYDIEQEVKVIQNKKIITTTIDAIRINHVRSFIDGNNEMKRNNGITIEYLVPVDNRINVRCYDWFNQDDIALDDKELIRKMTSIG